MDDKQILRNQIKVDEENLREDINSGFHNNQEAFEKETDRIQAKKKKLLEMEYPMNISMDYPLESLIDPYDIERDKELVKEYEGKLAH